MDELIRVSLNKPHRNHQRYGSETHPAAAACADSTNDHRLAAPGNGSYQRDATETNTPAKLLRIIITPIKTTSLSGNLMPRCR